MKTTITTEIDIPDGYEFVRVGKIHKGEYYIETNGKAMEWCITVNADCLIIVKPKTKLIVGAPYCVWNSRYSDDRIRNYYGEFDGEDCSNTTNGNCEAEQAWKNWQEIPHFDYSAFKKSLEV